MNALEDKAWDLGWDAWEDGANCPYPEDSDESMFWHWANESRIDFEAGD